MKFFFNAFEMVILNAYRVVGFCGKTVLETTMLSTANKIVFSFVTRRVLRYLWKLQNKVLIKNENNYLFMILLV